MKHENKANQTNGRIKTDQLTLPKTSKMQKASKTFIMMAA